jgi:hypothetical protein
VAANFDLRELSAIAELEPDGAAGQPAAARRPGRLAWLAALWGRLGPIGRLAGRVPPPILAGVGAGMAIVVLSVAVASLFGGGRPAAEARPQNRR